MPISQATIPKDFNNLWRVGGWFDGHEHAHPHCYSRLNEGKIHD